MSQQDPLAEALELLNEAEARINMIAGDWGHGTDRKESLVDRIRDFLVQHGVKPHEGK